MKSIIDFLRETLWVLYALYFQPTALKMHLDNQLTDIDGDPKNLTNIVGKIHQIGARRYLIQMGILCTFASLPPFAVMLLTPQLSNYRILWVYPIVSLIGLGMAFFRGALGPISAFIFAELILMSIYFNQGTLAIRLFIFTTDSYDILIGLLIGMAIGVILNLVSRGLRDQTYQHTVDNFNQWISAIIYITISCIAFMIPLSIITGIARDITPEIIFDTILIIAATIAIVITTTVAVAVWFSMVEAFMLILATSLAVSVSVAVAGHASAFFSVATLCMIIVLFSANVRFAVATIISYLFVTGTMSTILIGLTNLAHAPLSLVICVAVGLGFGLGSQRWDTGSGECDSTGIQPSSTSGNHNQPNQCQRWFMWDFVTSILLLIMLTPIWGLEYSERPLLWLISGIAGLLRLPLLLLHISWSAVSYLLCRQFNVNPIIMLATAPWKWDELIFVPLPYLEHILILATNQDQKLGLVYIKETSQTWRQVTPSQRSLVHLAANHLAQYRHERAIADAIDNLSWLPKPLPYTLENILVSMEEVSHLVKNKLAISNEEQLVNLSRAIEKLNDLLLLQNLDFFIPKYEHKVFFPILGLWRDILKRAIGSLPNPYIAGNPISTENRSLFVGREDILRQLDLHLLHRSQRPALFLFGQRRIGKSSLLYHLPYRQLNSDVIPILINCQAGEMSTSNAHLLWYLAKVIKDQANEHRGIVFPEIPSLLELQENSFIIWGEWFEKVERSLGHKRLLLALDESEALGKAIHEKWLDERILGFLHNLIQHHPKLDILLASSHRPKELGPLWSSYLISVNVLEISYLDPKKTRQLIEQPIPGFGLHYHPAAVDHIISLTRCQPLLVQLLCQELVHLLNERGEREATVAEVEAAIPRAFACGGTLYFQYLHDDAGEEGNAILTQLAKRGTGVAIPASVLTGNQPAYEAALQRLLARDLVEEVNGGIRFEVELVRRWWERQG